MRPILTEMDIAVHFVPREDITAYELALCLPYVDWLGGWKVKLIPEQIRRHFVCAYQPDSIEATELAQTFGPKNEIKLPEYQK